MDESQTQLIKQENLHESNGVNDEQSQNKRKCSIEFTDENYLKRSAPLTPSKLEQIKYTAHRDILGLIEKYIKESPVSSSARTTESHENVKSEATNGQNDENNNDLLSLAVLALDQHEKSQKNTPLKCEHQNGSDDNDETATTITTDHRSPNPTKYQNLYLNFYIDEEIVLDIKEYKLHECNLCFKKDIQNLNAHLRHSGECLTNSSEKSTSTCVYCNKTFDYKLQFNVHPCEYIDYDMPVMRKFKQTDQFYYLCKLCSSLNGGDNDDDAIGNDEKFLSYDSYKEHVTKCHVPSQINCSLCTQSYTQVDSYLRHLKNDHKISSIRITCEST